MNEARIEISMRKRKNTEIQSELLKIAKLDETPNPVSVKADNPTINLQQPNLHPFIGTPVNLKCQILVTIVHPVAHFMEFFGTSTLTEMLKLKKENLDIQEYFTSGDVNKQTPPQRNPRKVVNSSAELQKILSPKHKGSGIKAKESLFRSSSPHASSSQNPMDNNEMLRSTSIKTEQMRKLRQFDEGQTGQKLH